MRDESMSACEADGRGYGTIYIYCLGVCECWLNWENAIVIDE